MMRIGQECPCDFKLFYDRKDETHCGDLSSVRFSLAVRTPSPFYLLYSSRRSKRRGSSSGCKSRSTLNNPLPSPKDNNTTGRQPTLSTRQILKQRLLLECRTTGSCYGRPILCNWYDVSKLSRPRYMYTDIGLQGLFSLYKATRSTYKRGRSYRYTCIWIAHWMYTYLAELHHYIAECIEDPVWATFE